MHQIYGCQPSLKKKKKKTEQETTRNVGPSGEELHRTGGNQALAYVLWTKEPPHGRSEAKDPNREEPVPLFPITVFLTRNVVNEKSNGKIMSLHFLYSFGP